jgi:hypothetical protein
VSQEEIDLYLLLVLTAVGTLTVPAAGLLLGLGFDRWSSGLPIRLNLLALALAVGASVLLLMLPLRSGPPVKPDAGAFDYGRRSILEEDGLRGLLVFLIPVLMAAMPLLAEAVGPGQFSTAGRWLTLVFRALAAAFLVCWMYLLAASLVGFLYLPSAAAMAAALWRTFSPRRAWSPPG